VSVLVGTAGWSVAACYLQSIPAGGSHLERYGRSFPITEITTSFYRHHQAKTYAHWALSVGDDFRFCVKTPRTLTHEGSLVCGRSADLDRFLLEVAGLGGKLRALLVQLPPSLEFDRTDTARFFRRLRRRVPDAVAIVCEPRHESWSTNEVDLQLKELGVSRAAADPARWGRDAQPGGDHHLEYFRMHGSPRIYHSEYDSARLGELAGTLSAAARRSTQVWCIFDNTAQGHAIGNALALQSRLAQIHDAPITAPASPSWP
jgi:uncharacterized protein YecE (DUF72 family)